MFVIMSKGEKGFWSNEKGWVFGADSATRFQSNKGTLPMTPKKDAVWVPWNQVHGHSFLCGNIECGEELAEPTMVCPLCAMPVSHLRDALSA